MPLVQALRRPLAVRNDGYMSRPRKNPTPTVMIDPRVYEMAKTIEAMMEKRGLSQNQLSQLSGVDQSQISRFFQGAKSMSIDAMLNVLQVLQSALAIEEDPLKDVPIIGTLTNGKLNLYAGSVTMPGVFLVETGVGPFAVGDRVLVGPGDFTPGKWVIVEHPGGELRPHRCETREGLRLLTTAESVVYNPEIHKVVGVCKSRTVAL